MRLILTGVFVLLSWTALAIEPVSIQYPLAKPCRVSLAIYDNEGFQVRTLRNAEPQAAGRHRIEWDGLDQDGKPVTPGMYTWKLLQGQGLRAEYLFSFGVSTRELPWPGNHIGPTALAARGDDVYVVGTAAEGFAQVIKMNGAGDILWASGNYYWNVDDIAQADKLLYFVSTDLGHLAIVNAASGEMAAWSSGNGGIKLGAPTGATIKDLARPTATDVRGKVSLFRYDVPNNGGWNWYLGRATLRNTLDQPLTLKLGTSLARGEPIPFRELTLAPRETVTIELGNLGKVVVYWDSNQQFVFGVEGEPGWELQRLEIIATANRIAACPPTQPPEPIVTPQTPPWAVSSNQVWVGNVHAQVIQQIETKLGGKVLREVPVPGFQDLAFTRDGQLLVISGRAVCEWRGEKLEPVIRDLEDPRRLAVDQTTGDLFIIEWGTHHQVRRYDSGYKFHRVFGREGGRRYGVYQPEDFYHLDDVAGDGRGGFFVVEDWGVRRTAHFDAKGKLIKEWYGGQGYQQWITQDPRHADRFWLAGTFNTDVIECEVNWAKRDWRVRAVYNIQGALAKTLGGLLYAPNGYLSTRMHAAYHDLDGDRKPERLLWLEDYPGILLRIDENAGRLVPLAAAGFLQENEMRLLQSGQEDKRYAPLIQAYAGYPKNVPTPRYWTWADADGDGLMQSEEMRLFHGDQNGGFFVGGIFCAFQLGDDLSVWQRSGWGNVTNVPSWYVMKPEGYTKCGAPIWGYDTRVGSVASELFRHARVTKDSSYEIRIPPGEGYYANGWRAAGGHGVTWPGNMDSSTQVVRRDVDGRIRWRVGQHAALPDQEPGQLHSPIRVAGIVKDYVGIADRMRNPLAVWTTDGLYVGSLFDRRANDGLPARVYSCSDTLGPLPPGKERGYYFDRRTINQYDDMGSNGIFGLTPDGDVFHMSCGPNSAPTYRVTGWNELKRQQGRIKIRQSPEKPAVNGTGLSATYYPQPDFKGAPTRRVDPQLWFGGKISMIYKPWPLPAIASNACSAVWEGDVQPRFTEPGRLFVYLDTGKYENNPLPQRVRLWVNGKLEIDAWEKREYLQVHLPTRHFDWKAGERVPIRLEYSCDQPSDELGLCWESPSIEVQHVPAGCLYPATQP